MKRITILAYVTILCLTLLASACTNSPEMKNGTTNSGTADNTAGSAAEQTAPGTFPITKNKSTLTVMVPSNQFVKDFSTNEFTTWLEARTNVHIEWMVAPKESAQKKLNLVLAGGKYPDVILSFGVDPTQQMIYGKQGVFMPLNSLIDKYGVETKKMFADMPEVKKAITAPDGHIYSLPIVNECFHCSLKERFWIYKPWLDKLGLQMPTTPDELETVLKAFKTEDPNGNGKADEIPLSGAYLPLNGKIYPGSMTFLEGFIMNAFIYNDGSRLILENGKVQSVVNQQGWKDGLTYLHKLYAEGLIAPQTFTQNTDQLKQLGENPNVAILGATPAFSTGTFTQLYAKSNRWIDYVDVPPLKGPNGQVAGYYPYDAISPGQFLITSACKHPDIAFRWADEFYSEELTLRSVFGREGKEWRWANPGEKGINGGPGIWARLNEFGQLQNFYWAQTGISLRTRKFRSGQVEEPGKKTINSVLYQITARDYDPKKQQLSKVVPPLWFTDEQSGKLADLSKTVNDYVSEMTARFITGDASLDKDWNDYLNKLDQIGLKDYLQIYQTAYDASYKH